MTEPKLPERIGRLEELANNLWWSWHKEARDLFRALDYPLWRRSGHNPVKELRAASPEMLQAAATDPSFVAQYDAVLATFDAEMADHNSWFAGNCPDFISSRPVAYFSMEYAIHNSLPIYAGGLGVLAGDLCKGASDLGIPMVAIGFVYPQGYFHQHILVDGWQQEIYQQLDFGESPIKRVLSPAGEISLARVALGDVIIGIGVWLVQVGRTKVYLLDTNLEENPPQYRQLAARLYIADQEVRIQQEIILGIGGVRVLRTLGINPSVWHANEGHTAFMMLERARQEVAAGVPFADALEKVRTTSVFTTHTPVLAGHDVFAPELVDKYFSSFWKGLGIDRETFFQLGRQDDSGDHVLNMTALALRMTNHRNAVSQLHGKVTRKMWHNLWPAVPEEQVPISSVTNGVHTGTWLAPELCHIFDKYLGENWAKKQDDRSLWAQVVKIPDEQLWAVHQQLKRKFFGAVRERMRNRWTEDDVPWKQVLAMGAFLDPETLTIAFVRRFTDYKRPTLILKDMERLKRIINMELQPVQIVFAGKSHPADWLSKHLIQHVYSLAADRECRGRIIFIEDYDMHIAHYLTQGVDVWLNTPRRLQEACGTSGMKASLNGVLHMSVRDGWWDEGYNGRNGWAIGPGPDGMPPEKEDEIDAESIYRLLEEQVLPLYYARDRGGVPRGWTQMVKEAISTIAPVFCSQRMLKAYTEQMYQPAAGLSIDNRTGISDTKAVG